MNFIVIPIAAVVPLLIGFVWYNPKTFGTIWMKEADMTEEKMKGANMMLIFGLAYVFGLLASLALMTSVIHQTHVMSVLVNEPGFNETGSEINLYYQDFMNRFGNNFRTFKHGALHGTFMAILLALPVMATNALFERKSFKYIAINVGFWIVCFALMGGIICQFA